MPTEEQKAGAWAVLFPGQGSQENNMGRDIAEFDSEVMRLWEKTEKAVGERVREIYWDGDEEAMSETRYLQPALTATALGIWMSFPFRSYPDYLAGHSVGEYVALAAAGVLNPEEVIDLVALRARLMSEAGEQESGKMAVALKMDQESVEAIVDEARTQTDGVLCLANYNTPQQFVLSGSVQSVDAAAALVKERRGRAQSLPVSGAFHSPLMDEAAKELAGYMDKLQWSSARIPVHMNVNARPETRGESIKELIKWQIVSPVLWSQIILDQWDRGVRKWLEFGPKGVLVRMLPSILGKQSPWKAEHIDSRDKLNHSEGILA